MRCRNEYFTAEPKRKLQMGQISGPPDVIACRKFLCRLRPFLITGMSISALNGLCYVHVVGQ